MSIDLRGRSFLRLRDFAPVEVHYLLDLAAELKAARAEGKEVRHLEGRIICLIFEKPSTRTMCAFEVASFEQGAQVTYLGPSGSQIGHKESMKDTARVLGRMYHAIEYRGASQAKVDELAAYAGVPVYNGLTDEYHPTQMLADLLTMREHAGKPLGEIAYAFVGDGRSNMGRSLMVAGCLMGMDVRIGTPAGNRPDAEQLDAVRRLADRHGARLTITEDPVEAVRGCDFLHTDVWVSMGEPEEVWGPRIEALSPYRVTAELMAATGNPSVRFMHCLPAFHNRDTIVGEAIFQKYGVPELEVTDAVFESPAGIQFDQAENRLHTIKAVLVATIGR